MHFDEAKNAVLSILRQQGKAKNSEMLALIGGDAAVLERVREDLLFEALAEDMRTAGLRYTGIEEKPLIEPAADVSLKIFLSCGRRDASDLAERLEQDLKAHRYEVWRDKCGDESMKPEPTSPSVATRASFLIGMPTTKSRGGNARQEDSLRSPYLRDSEKTLIFQELTSFFR
jgi:hypothetical protein